MALIALIEEGSRRVVRYSCLCGSHDDEQSRTMIREKSKDFDAVWMYVRGGFCDICGSTSNTDQNPNYPNAGNTYKKYYSDEYTAAVAISPSEWAK